MVPEDPLMVSISSNSLLHPDEITRKTFPTARRGLDAEAVRRYLEALSSDLRQMLERESELRHRLADAERRAAEPEIDEATLTRAVGSETARILQTAHSAARDVIANAEARAAQLADAAEGLVAERSAAADQEAAGILAAAEKEAVLLAAATMEEARSLRDSAQQDADELVAAAGNEAAAVLASTKQECRQMVREARELRHRVLNDLAERRRALRVQLAQLRTGRDSLIEVVDAVGDAVDKVRDRLATAEHEARLAAAQAGERVEQYDHDEDLVEEQQLQPHLGSVDETSEEELVAAGAALRPRPATARAALAGGVPRASGGTEVIEPQPAAPEGRADEQPVAEPPLAAPIDQPYEHDLVMALAVDEGLATEGLATEATPGEGAVPARVGPADVQPADVQPADVQPADVQPADDAVTEPGAGAPIQGQHRSVGDLFARLRAGRGSGAADPRASGPLRESPAGSVGGSPAADDEPGAQVARGDTATGEAGDHGNEAAEAETATGHFVFDVGLEPAVVVAPQEVASEHVASDQVAPQEVGVLGSSSSHVAALEEADDDPATAAEAATAQVRDEEPAGEGELAAAALSRRTELLSPVVTRLSRALKRALQDDQNELLDSIRHASGDADLNSLLPPPAHRLRYEQAASLALSDAWTLGRLFVAADDDDQRADGAEKIALMAEDAGRELAGNLALELTGMLRRRLSESLVAAGGLKGPPHDVTGAAYREWKGPRIEAVAGDFAVAAFSKGEVAAGEGMLVRWLVDDEGQPCPDCDDNSLAGPQAVGEPFPTGQPHPPVHAGCRCLLVPARQVLSNR